MVTTLSFLLYCVSLAHRIWKFKIKNNYQSVFVNPESTCLPVFRFYPVGKLQLKYCLLCASAPYCFWILFVIYFVTLSCSWIICNKSIPILFYFTNINFIKILKWILSYSNKTEKWANLTYIHLHFYLIITNLDTL